MSLIQAEALSRSFAMRRGLLRPARQVFAVRDVDLTIGRAEIVGVVGESGCGKSTLGRLLLRLLTPSAGQVRFDGRDMAGLSGAELRRVRRRMQMVFQDPFGSLDPRRSVGAQIGDGLAERREDRVAGLLVQVGLAADHAGRLPEAFSGGQRQRIAIARALATEPDFIVADEPVAALDVSIQAQIVNLLADLRGRLGLAMLFVSHDLHVVRHLADRLVVMYLGRVVEEGPAAEVFRSPAHPYTRALLAATPTLRGPRTQSTLRGELPSPLDPPSGCVFRTRCAHARPCCAEARPALLPSDAGRRVACLRVGEIGLTD